MNRRSSLLRRFLLEPWARGVRFHTPNRTDPKTIYKKEKEQLFAMAAEAKSKGRFFVENIWYIKCGGGESGRVALKTRCEGGFRRL